MKIPLMVRERFNQLMPFVPITIKARHVRRSIPVIALVDTGSPWLALTPKDIGRLNIPMSAPTKPKEFPIIGFAGSRFWRYLLTDVTVFLRTETDEIVSVSLPSISLLWPTKGKSEEFEALPNVIGSDFLTIGQFALHFNPSEGTAFLERK